MFKLVVLCAFLAAVVAEPGLLVSPHAVPLTTVVSPASTVITKQASSVLHPSPFVYSSPLAYTHFIKKRSPQYIAPIGTYLAGSPVVTTAYSTPYIQPAPVVTTLPAPLTVASHFIKKRSAPLAHIVPTTYTAATPFVASSYSAVIPKLVAPTTYVASSPVLTSAYATPYVSAAPLVSAAPIAAHLIKKRSAPLLNVPLAYTAASPFVATSYSATGPIIAASPYISSASLLPQTVAYSAHLIKKRSAPFVTTYVAPTSYSHQSRIDVHGSPFVTSYSTPLTYSAPIAAVSHIL